MPAPKDLIKKEIWKERLSKSHEGLTPWNKGKHLSNEAKKRVSEKMREFWSNPENKEKIEARNKKISEAMKGDKNPAKRSEMRKQRSQWMKERDWVGDKNPAKRPEIRGKISRSLKGHLVLPATRKQIKKTLKGKYTREKNPFYGKRHTEETKEKNRIRAVKELASGKLRRGNTSIEWRVEKELRKRNIYYKKQYPLNNITVIDFYLPQYRIAIYCDGIFWHKSDWAKKQGVIEKDKNQTKILSINGYKVFRFDETEINKSVKRCVDKVIKYLNKS